MQKYTPTYKRIVVSFLLLLFSSAFLLHEWHTVHFHNSEKIPACCTNSDKPHWHDENTHHHCDWLCGALPTNFESAKCFVLHPIEKLIPQKSIFSFLFCFTSSPFSFSRGRAPPQ